MFYETLNESFLRLRKECAFSADAMHEPAGINEPSGMFMAPTMTLFGPIKTFSPIVGLTVSPNARTPIVTFCIITHPAPTLDPFPITLPTGWGILMFSGMNLEMWQEVMKR